MTSLPPKVIYKDSYFLVLDKPSGMVVNWSKSAKGETLQDWVVQNFRLHGTGEDFVKRAGIVHRLDKETSGLIIVALDERVFLPLQREFKSREVKKSYLCLAHGAVSEENGVIEAPLGRDPFHRQRFTVLSEGRPARTYFEVICHCEEATNPLPVTLACPESVSDPRERILESSFDRLRTPQNDNQTDSYTLLRVFPQTGRTHQIRVHLKHIGHALVADELYAGRKTARKDRVFCPRLFLHAASITFKHPITRRILTLESPLPQDLKVVLDTLASF